MEDKEEKEEKPKIVIPKEALVPFANPLADEKQMRKLLRSVKKGIPHLSHFHWAQISALHIFIFRAGESQSQLRQHQRQQIETALLTLGPCSRQKQDP